MKKKRAPRRKHVPQRTCVVCREKIDKRMLTRVVNNPDEGLIIDPSGKKNGRGAYICDQAHCWEKVGSSQILDKALRIEIAPEVRRALVVQFENRTGE